MSLPWLLLHGELVSTALMACFLIAGGSLPVVAGRVLARRRARTSLAALQREPGTGAFPGAPVVLAGRLRVDGDACQRFEDGSPAAAATAELRSRRRGRATARARADALFVDGEVPVELVGPVQVWSGSRERAPRRRVGRLGVGVVTRLTGAVDAAPLAAHARFRSVADGDRVWVVGVLDGGETTDPAPSGPAPVRHLFPRPPKSAEEDPAIRVVFAGAPRVGLHDWPRWLLGAALGGLLWFALDAWLGAWALQREDYSVAFVTTRHREARSHYLYRLLDELPERPEVASVTALAESSGDLGKIHAAIAALWATGHREAAEALIWRHPNRDLLELLYDTGDRPRIERLALDRGYIDSLTGPFVAEGRFEEASHRLEAHPRGGGGVYSDPRPAVVVHLLAGRLEAALGEFDPTRHSVPWDRGERCLRPALRYRLLHDPASLEELRASALPERPPERRETPCPTCSTGSAIGMLLLAEALPRSQALPLLERCEDCEQRYPRATWLLRYRIYGCVDPTVGPAQARCHRLTWTAARVLARSPRVGPKTVTAYGLSAPLLEALEAQPEPDVERRLVRALLEEDHAALDGATGEIEAALHRFARAREDWTVLGQRFAERVSPRSGLDIPMAAKLDRLAQAVDPEDHRRATLLDELRLALVTGQRARARSLDSAAAGSCPRIAVELGDPFCLERAHLRELEPLLEPSTVLAPDRILALVTRELPQFAGHDEVEAALWTGDVRSLEGRTSPALLGWIGRSLHRNRARAAADIGRALYQSADGGSFAFSFELSVAAVRAFEALGDAERTARARAAVAAYRRAWLRPETALALLACE